MPRSSPTPQDDRGQPCGLADLTSRQLRERALGTSRQSTDPISRGEARLTLFAEACGTLVGVGMGILLWERVVARALGAALTPIVDVVGQWAFALVVGFTFWRVSLTLARRGRWAKIASLFLAQGQCAGCGYGLSGIDQTGDDGRVVCPECGAAWRKDRIGAADHGAEARGARADGKQG